MLLGARVLPSAEIIVRKRDRNVGLPRPEQAAARDQIRPTSGVAMVGAARFAQTFVST